MITPQAIQLRRLAAEVLSTLHVDDSASVADVRELADGTWMIRFDDRAPATRFPTFDVALSPDWSRVRAAQELRAALREKLWICPQCQRRARIRRIVDQEAFRVECARCGRFEIEGDRLAEFQRT